MTRLTDCRALITGASSGIGKATAMVFAKAGCELILVGRSPSRLAGVAAEVEQFGIQPRIFAVDLAEVEQVKDTVRAIADEAGPIDILINNAGIGYTGDLFSTPLADWQQVLNLNLTSVFQCIQGVLPGMRDRQRGVIINITSIAGHQAFPGWGAYNVSKAGVIALSKTLAAEERSHGIRVMTVCPGAVNTPIWDTNTVQADFDRSKMLTPDVVAQSILHAATLPAGAVIDELIVMPSAGAL